MNACDKAREAYNRADRRADVLRNRWETLLCLAAKRDQLRKLRKAQKEMKS